MAMEATHIRFALDIAAILKPSDVKAYVAGSVYPDSRYVSGVDRLATHPKDYEHDAAFKSSDFRKGWYSHLLCDDIQWKVMADTLPIVIEGSAGQGGESWVKRTAVKVLQDMDDVRKFDLGSHLPALDYFEAPNGEDEEVLRSYYLMLRDSYESTPEITVIDEMNVWDNFNIGDELLAKVTETVKEYENDAKIMEVIHTIYGTMLVAAKTHSKVLENIGT
jgi:hypothetical protein